MPTQPLHPCKDLRRSTRAAYVRTNRKSTLRVPDISLVARDCHWHRWVDVTAGHRLLGPDVKALSKLPGHVVAHDRFAI